MRKTAAAMAAIFRQEDSMEVLSVAELDRRVRALGYRLDRTMDCRSNARLINGPHAGISYPCCTTDIVEIDTGLSFANVDARRGGNFRALQRLRLAVCALSKGAVLEI